MKIRIFGIAPESIVDGRGIRLAIFVQGCCHHCKGCHNPESHPLDGGKLYDTAEIIAMMGNPLLDGITLSAANRFCKPSRVESLLPQRMTRA